MPPIPKFAQVLAKRAKAKPKVISGNPVTKKIASNQTKKFAKDDMELANVQKEKIRKKIEPFLKKSKDDLELLKSRKSEFKELEEFLPDNTLKNIDSIIFSVTEISETNIAESNFSNLKEYANGLEEVFYNIKSIADSFNLSNTIMVKYIGEIAKFTNTLNKLDIKNPKTLLNTMNKLKSIANKIIIERNNIKE